MQQPLQIDEDREVDLNENEHFMNSWNKFNNDDTLNYIRIHGYNNHYTNLKISSKSPDINSLKRRIEIDLSSEAEEALSPIYELWEPEFEINFDVW